MDSSANFFQWIQPWWQAFDYCFNVNPVALICEPFWNRAIIAFIVFGILGVVVGVWKYVSYRRKYFAAIRAQWERDSIDEVGIRESQWNGEKAYQAHLSDDEVLAQIKAAVEQRRRDGANT